MSTPDNQEPEGERCARCGEVGQDRRTLWMSCLYAMEETGIPFDTPDPDASPYHIRFYTLRVCKACRGQWLAAIKEWFHNVPAPPEEDGDTIYVRELGATVVISRAEWDRRQKERQA
jgi:hypothetical protein